MVLAVKEKTKELVRKYWSHKIYSWYDTSRINFYYNNFWIFWIIDWVGLLNFIGDNWKKNTISQS